MIKDNRDEQRTLDEGAELESELAREGRFLDAGVVRALVGHLAAHVDKPEGPEAGEINRLLEKGRVLTAAANPNGVGDDGPKAPKRGRPRKSGGASAADAATSESPSPSLASPATPPAAGPPSTDAPTAPAATVPA